MSDITASAMFEAAAAEARAESRRHWASGGDGDRKYPLQPLARFWLLPNPRDPDGILFLNARGVRVLCAIDALLMMGDADAIEGLIHREITRVPECP